MQRSIEILIGRLITDEEFRHAFQRDPHATLGAAQAWGLELSPGEIRALTSADRSMWDRFAEQVDSRLQKASLKLGTEPPT